MIEMRHPAATPVGMAVRAKATLRDGRPAHERFLVPDQAGFRERAMKKGQA